jgi:hypothetical protein
VAGDDGELSRGDEVVKDLLDAASAEAGAPLEGGLIGVPLAVVVGVGGDGEEDHEMGASLGGLVEDGGHVLSAHRSTFPACPGGTDTDETGTNMDGGKGLMMCLLIGLELGLPLRTADCGKERKASKWAG